MSIVVLDYGMGNIHSIVKALRLFHDDVVFTSDADALRSCRAMVLPGDGHFEAAMQNLRGHREDLLREHVAKERPLLGVCIGFQVLFDDSDERDGKTHPAMVGGLGLLRGNVRRFRFADPRLRVPHMGWNTLSAARPDLPAHLTHSMYFIHSYRPTGTDAADAVTMTEYGGDLFPSTVQKGSIFACQYHPEKSDAAGLRLLREWVGRI